MLLSEMIKYLTTVTQAEGRSYRTVQSYRERLGHVCDFLGDVPIEDITTADLQRYTAHLWDCDLSQATIASRVRALRRLWNLAEAEGIITENPARRIEVPRRRKEMPKQYYAKDEDILALLETTREGTPLDVRDRAVMQFLLDTGCRTGELCSLETDNLDLDRMSAAVAKTGKGMRFVSFGESTREALQKWLDVRPSGRGPWVFVGLTGHSKGALTPDGLRRMLERRGKVAGCEGPVTPRAFRHVFARQWLMSGSDLETLARVLGHSSTEVTGSYHATSEAGGAR